MMGGDQRTSHRGVVATAARLAGISVSELTGDNRSDVMVIRRLAVAVVLRKRGLSTNAIGRLIKRDHTTVLHLLRTRATEPAVIEMADMLEREVTEPMRDWVEAWVEQFPQLEQPQPAKTKAKVDDVVASNVARKPVPPLNRDRSEPFSAQWWHNNDHRFRAAISELAQCSS